MPTLVDTNVLLDVFSVGSAWEQWSMMRLFQARETGPVLVNQLILAEMAAGFERETDLDAALPASRFIREELPWDAAFLAGRAFAMYKQAGGLKRSPLPDFYIGAHALARGHALLTRDASRYRTYFPTIDIVAPDTHP